VDTTKEYIRHLSLCSGYEGIGLGLRRVFPNVREVAHVEIEAFAIANLVAKMEENKISPAPIWTDLKTFPYEKFLGKVDCLSAGFPCPPFSQAGKREGVKDPRHLYPYISDGIGRCRPRLVFLENVEGIISSKTETGRSVLLHVLQDLESMGYIAEAGVFSASEVGAPHQRKRVFILAHSISVRSRGRITSGSSGMDSERSETSQEGQTQCDIRSEVERCGGKLQTKELGNPSSERSHRRSENRGKESSEMFGKRSKNVGGQTKEVADSSSARTKIRVSESEQRQERDSEKFNYNSDRKWPSRPGEPQHDWEEPRTTPKPQLGGAANGASSRVDRLRLLGNGVVPQTVEVAFRTLIKRIEERIKLI